MAKFAVTHPGKIGDTLFALHVARSVSESRGCEPVDFYTSSYCTPLKRLFEYQDHIEELIVPDGYVIERMDMGVQPWRMTVPNKYETVYHLGFRKVPNTTLHFFMADSIGIQRPEIFYKYPEDFPAPEEPYMIVAPRGETTFKGLFYDVIAKSPIKTVQIGGKWEFIGGGEKTIDMTGTDFLETATLLAHATAFVGLMSSQLVLANGFDIPKVAPHDGRSWDMTHVAYSPTNFYPVNPTAEQVIEIAMSRSEEG